MATLRILRNPYGDPAHRRAIVDVLDTYASDPVGGGEGLSAAARERLVPGLEARPWVVTLLALDGEKPVGLLIAIEGFSTFKSRPLLNIHDVAVVPSRRGTGVGSALFAAAEQVARERNCCKLTLEVLSGNAGARRLYERIGFRPYALDPAMGTAEFWEKPLICG